MTAEAVPTLRVGDRVKLFERDVCGSFEDPEVRNSGWFVPSPVFTIRRITGPHLCRLRGPYSCNCHCYGIECGMGARDPHAAPWFQVTLRNEPPHHTAANELYINVCSIPRQPWRMRRQGVALVLHGRPAIRPRRPDLFNLEHAA